MAFLIQPYTPNTIPPSANLASTDTCEKNIQKHSVYLNKYVFSKNMEVIANYNSCGFILNCNTCRQTVAMAPFNINKNRDYICPGCNPDTVGKTLTKPKTNDKVQKSRDEKIAKLKAKNITVLGIRSENDVTFASCKCDTCGHEFEGRFQHMATSSPKPCPKCREVFVPVNTAAIAQQNEADDYFAVYKVYRVNKKDILSNRQEFKCGVCSNNFYDTPSVLKYNLTTNSSYVACPTCRKETKSESKLASKEKEIIEELNELGYTPNGSVLGNTINLTDKRGHKINDVKLHLVLLNQQHFCKECADLDYPSFNAYENNNVLDSASKYLEYKNLVLDVCTKHRTLNQRHIEKTENKAGYIFKRQIMECYHEQISPEVCGHYDNMMYAKQEYVEPQYPSILDLDKIEYYSVEFDDISDFAKKHSLKDVGCALSDPSYVGAYYNGILIGFVTFSKPNRTVLVNTILPENAYELVSICIHETYRNIDKEILDGLLSVFKAKQEWSYLYTYAKDEDSFNYKEYGFEYQYLTNQYNENKATRYRLVNKKELAPIYNYGWSYGKTEIVVEKDYKFDLISDRFNFIGEVPGKARCTVECKKCGTQKQYQYTGEYFGCICETYVIPGTFITNDELAGHIATLKEKGISYIEPVGEAKCKFQCAHDHIFELDIYRAIKNKTPCPICREANVDGYRKRLRMAAAKIHDAYCTHQSRNFVGPRISGAYKDKLIRENHIDFLNNQLGIKLLEEDIQLNKNQNIRYVACGHEFNTRPSTKIYNAKNYGGDWGSCPTCRFEKIRKNYNDYVDIDVRSKLDGMGYDLIDEGPYESNGRYQVINRECGHSFKTILNRILTGVCVCPVCNKERKQEFFKRKNRERSAAYHAVAPEWKIYQSKVTSLTRRNYSENMHTINPNNYPFGKAGVDGAYHLDHILPMRWCFDNEIPVEQCAAVENLRVIPWMDNVSKNMFFEPSMPKKLLAMAKDKDLIHMFKKEMKKLLADSDVIGAYLHKDHVLFNQHNFLVKLDCATVDEIENTLVIPLEKWRYHSNSYLAFIKEELGI